MILHYKNILSLLIMTQFLLDIHCLQVSSDETEYPLHTMIDKAKNSDDIEAIKEVLKLKKDELLNPKSPYYINKQDANGETPLHKATRYLIKNKHFLNLVIMLISNNADISIENKKNETIFHIIGPTEYLISLDKQVKNMLHAKKLNPNNELIGKIIEEDDYLWFLVLTEKDHKIVGHAVVEKTTADTYEFHRLHIMNTANRNQHIGPFLFTSVVETLKKMGGKTLKWHASPYDQPENTNTFKKQAENLINFYIHLGGKIKKLHDNGSADMEYDLQSTLPSRL